MPGQHGAEGRQVRGHHRGAARERLHQHEPEALARRGAGPRARRPRRAAPAWSPRRPRRAGAPRARPAPAAPRPGRRRAAGRRDGRRGPAARRAAGRRRPCAARPGRRPPPCRRPRAGRPAATGGGHEPTSTPLGTTSGTRPRWSTRVRRACSLTALSTSTPRSSPPTWPAAERSDRERPAGRGDMATWTVARTAGPGQAEVAVGGQAAQDAVPDARRDGLVDVDDVEPGQGPAGGPAARDRVQGEPRGRAVGGQADRRPGRDDGHPVDDLPPGRPAGARGEHLHVLAEVGQGAGQAEHLLADAAGHVDVVGADQPDPQRPSRRGPGRAAEPRGREHGLPRAHHGAGSRPTSATKTAWSMCQSTGRARMLADRSSATRWLAAATAAGEASGTSNGGWKVMTVPHPDGEAAVRSYVMPMASSSAPGAPGEHRGPAGHPGRLAEQVDDHAAPGQVPVGEQRHEDAVAQALLEHRRHAGARLRSLPRRGGRGSRCRAPPGRRGSAGTPRPAAAAPPPWSPGRAGRATRRRRGPSCRGGPARRPRRGPAARASRTGPSPTVRTGPTTRASSQSGRRNASTQ